MKNNNLTKQKGVSLIEVMIAVVVFSFGLLGIAGVMTASLKVNQSAFQRSQAVLLATSINEMMAKNNFAVWQGLYNGVYSGSADISALCTGGGGCDSVGLVQRDTQLWSNMITQTLPNSTGTIACNNIGTISPLSDVDSRANPYLGICTITLNWSESNHLGTSAESYSIPLIP